MQTLIALLQHPIASWNYSLLRPISHDSSLTVHLGQFAYEEY